MKKIKIVNSNDYALVDDEDYEWLKDLRWRLAGSKNRYYAMQSSSGSNVYMHQLVLLAKNDFMEPKLGLHCDHINGNPLDNRQSNLRYVTPQQNTWNRKARKTNPQSKHYSRYIGVYKERNGNSFTVTICNKFIGTFKSEIEAAKAYDAAVIKDRGQFAVLNFPLT